MRAQLKDWSRSLVAGRPRRDRLWFRALGVVRMQAVLLLGLPIVIHGALPARIGLGASMLVAALILLVQNMPGHRRFDRFWWFPPVSDTLLVLLTIGVTGGASSELGWIAILHPAAMSFMYGTTMGAACGSLLSLGVAGMIVADPGAPRVTSDLTFLLMMWAGFAALSYLNDTAERHRRDAEAQNLRAQDLQALSDAKQQFIGIASHELRTPLTIVKGYNSLLQIQLKRLGEEELAEYSREIGRATDRMGLLIDELLDFGRMQSGQLPLRPEIFALEGLARDVVNVLGVLAGQRRQRLDLEILGTRVPLQADPRRIEQVLINLLRNALKYSPEGTNVRLCLRYLGETIRCEVIDHGPGIAPEHHAHLFTPFYRALPDMDPTEGVGLGLAICQAIVHAHGGRMGLESVQGKGSVFWFELPVGAPAEVAIFG